MTIEDLKKNLEQEKRIISDMNFINLQMRNSDLDEKRFFLLSLNSFKQQLRILNDAVPDLLERISQMKAPEGAVKKPEENSKVVSLSYVSPTTKEKRFITINKKDKNQFIKELSLSESGLKSLKKSERKKDSGLKAPSKIAHFSNLFFRKISEKISPQFTSVKDDLKKANIRFLISTYVSIALFFSSAIFIFSFLVVFLLFVFGIVSWMWILAPFVLMGLSLACFYFYPTLEKSGVEKKITDELPFATIYMAAIAGSNIEPVKIFQIISMSSEYPAVGLEIKKIINQIYLYGYDLVTALKSASERSSNKKLSELFSGMATNILSGGSLKNYLEKKSENLLMDYKMERQKYNTLAETFMDIYISVLVAAPLILMMMLIIMNITGFGFKLSTGSIMILSIGGVALVNVIFLVVLQLKQPKT